MRPRTANDGVTPLFQQQKFIAQTGGTPIPIASWNEAQLIYAEAVGWTGGTRCDQPRAHGERRSGASPVRRRPGRRSPIVLEERRRQLFSEGQRYGDMLRYNCRSRRA